MKYIFALFFLFGCSSSIVAQVLKTTEQDQNARASTTATIDTSLSPNVGSYYTLLAYLHAQAGSYKSAQAAYLKALQFSTSSNTYYSLGLLNDFKLKDKLTALRYYRKYLKSNPDEKLAEENRSYVKGRVKALAK
jgi:tetratricopeptide (TPR) repeat protein